MSTLLKHMYSEEFYEKFSKLLTPVISDFNKKKFFEMIFDESWKEKELKDRMRHTSFILKNFLSDDYQTATEQILQILNIPERKESLELGFEYMFFPDYIETYGLDNYEISMQAIEKVTQFTSCEFAIRPFIINNSEKTLQQMNEWSKHSHPMVRRLASEGSRPRLPWAMALPKLKKDPTPLFSILENLKNDESESVRRSVANNLNDISKDNPEIVLGICQKWKGQNKNTDGIIKHGLRTLLKQGNQKALDLIGFGHTKNIEMNDIKILTPQVKMGNEMVFTFIVENKDTNKQKLRLEYAMYFLRANGSLSKKVFQISEKEYVPNSKTKFEKKYSFRSISTRKYYSGKHEISVIINGKESEKLEFEVIKK